MEFRKPQTKAGRVDMHSVCDKAIDVGATTEDGLAKYEATLDASLLVLHPGRELATFEVHIPSRDRANDLVDQARDGRHLARIFWRACVRAVHGVVLVQDDGTRATGSVSGKDLEYFETDVVMDIGLRAWRMATETGEGFSSP